MVYPELESILIIKMSLKKIINYKERNKYQTSFFYKKYSIKECREFWRFSIKRRGGPGCCGAGDVIVSVKPSSSSIG